jgi:oligopeptide transport system ATP-binding protein
MTGAILEVSDLNTQFDTPDGVVQAVNGISFSLMPGESVGVVGESGSGKSQLFLSIMGLLADNGVAHGSAKLDGQELIGLKAKQLNKIRGSRISMIFQDPMTSLNPLLTIERQLTEILEIHQGVSADAARQQSIEMLNLVGIPNAEQRIDLYPHEFSGGMRQRVMIAMALLCKPDVLIADEPTTALDVTIQAQIIDILADIKTRMNTAVITITHDLGVVAGLCDRVIVMYAGQIVEIGHVNQIFHDPRHPYTRGLLNSMPRLDEVVQEMLDTIAGQPPDMQKLPMGCAFSDRCSHSRSRCNNIAPVLTSFAEHRAVACHRQWEINAE